MRVVKCDAEGLAEAAAVLLKGGVVVMPTDTVYGLAAHPGFPAAVDRLYGIKGRDPGKPIALLAADAAATPVVHPLTAKWPGALTIVYAGEGYRVPDHAGARALIRACGGLLRVTSANMSGRRPATDAEAALADVGLSADLVVDGGVSPGGVASTVVRVSSAGEVSVLRQGALKI